MRPGVAGGLRPLRRAMLADPVLEVAPMLLGRRVVSGHGADRVVARLVEVEAYDGSNDPASHAFRGRTARNSVMFGPAGHAYVYFTYGMHFCLNVSTGPDGRASAVLLRAAEIVSGIDLARARRGAVSGRDLARGPARLCSALGVDRALNGTDLCDMAGPIWLAAGPAVDPKRIRTGPRVGISRAAERPWRFWIADEPAVSAYRPARQTRCSGEQV